MEEKRKEELEEWRKERVAPEREHIRQDEAAKQREEKKRSNIFRSGKKQPGERR